jgi:hypothetical protein
VPILINFFGYNYSIVGPKDSAVLLRFKNALQNIVGGVLKSQQKKRIAA